MTGSQRGSKVDVMIQEDVFLMRRWRDNDEDAWRFSVKDVHSGKINFFSTQTALFDFLIQSSSPITPTHLGGSMLEEID